MEAIDQFLQSKAQSCEKQQKIIEQMMDSGDYDWAEKILISFYDFIWYNGFISNKQIQVINNIRSKSYVRKSIR